MGLGPAAVQLTLEMWTRGQFKSVRSVVEIGSQEIHVRHDEFERMLADFAVPGYRPTDFPNIANYPGQPRCSAAALYRLLGAPQYSCVDINGEFGAIKHDLNKPFEDAVHLGKYDLVTDYGSTEHAFDIAESYRTMHRLCKAGGTIIALQQIFGGNGFYNFDPSFFESLAAANGYEVRYASYVVVTTSGGQFHVPRAQPVFDTLDLSKVSTVGVAYVFHKKTGAEFRVPYQGDYLAAAQGNYGYRLQRSVEPPGRSYVPVFGLESLTAATLARELMRRVRRRLGLGG